MKVKDPVVSNVEDVQQATDPLIDEWEEELDDLRKFIGDLSRTAVLPDKSFVDSFAKTYYRKHGHKYDDENAKEALTAELGEELDYIDDNTTDRRSAGKLGSILSEEIENQQDAIEEIKQTLELFNGIRYEIDEDFRRESDFGDGIRLKPFLKVNGKTEELDREVFEEDVSKNPGEVEKIDEHFENLDEAEEYLEKVAHGLRQMHNQEEFSRFFEDLYKEENFTYPLLNGVVTSIRAIREEREKTEEFLTYGTEHDYVLERWKEHLERKTENTDWDILGVETEYRAEDTNGEFDILLGGPEELIYLEVKPDPNQKEDAYKQIDRAVDADEIVNLTPNGYRHLKNEDMKGYVVQGLPDYTEDTIELLENGENKSILSR